MTASIRHREVECPACHHRQQEVWDVIGTQCRECRESFAVDAAPATRRWPLATGARRFGARMVDTWDAARRRWNEPLATGRLCHPKHVSWDPSKLENREIEAAWDEYGRWLACPWCQAPAWLPTMAQTHACGECGRHFPLRDHVISSDVHANLVTAGRVWVRRRGRLISTSLRCGELIVFGRTEGSVTVTGRAEFYGRGETVGELHCGHLIVVRGAQHTFHQRVFAMTADIHGELTGDVCCAGRLHIPHGATIHGSVLAGQIALDAGGTVHGTMGTLPPNQQPEAYRTETARELLHNFGHDGSG